MNGHLWLLFKSHQWVLFPVSLPGLKNENPCRIPSPLAARVVDIILKRIMICRKISGTFSATGQICIDFKAIPIIPSTAVRVQGCTRFNSQGFGMFFEDIYFVGVPPVLSNRTFIKNFVTRPLSFVNMKAQDDDGFGSFP